MGMRRIDFKDQIEKFLREQNDDGSHVEPDPNVFHASWSGYCKRQIYISKTGIGVKTAEDLGRLHTGTRIHEEIETRIMPGLPASAEKKIDLTFQEYDDLQIIGHADAYTGTSVYDFKTRSSWYRHNPPIDRHILQLQVYMMALEASEGQIVYISKSDYEVRKWPEWYDDEDRDYIEPDQSRIFQEVLPKFERVREAVREVPDPEYEEDIPFEKCGCWICDNQEVKLPSKTTNELDPEEETLDV